jgi:hypothetical protein
MSDVVWLLWMSFPAGLAWYVILWFQLRGLCAMAIRDHTGSKETAIVSDEQLAIARKFHRSLFALFCSWIPMALLVLGNTACSLIRDAGYVIFPWWILTPTLLWGLASFLTYSIRLRRLRKLLFPTPPEAR